MAKKMYVWVKEKRKSGRLKVYFWKDVEKFFLFFLLNFHFSQDFESVSTEWKIQEISDHLIIEVNKIQNKWSMIFH